MNKYIVITLLQKREFYNHKQAVVFLQNLNLLGISAKMYQQDMFGKVVELSFISGLSSAGAL